MQPGNQEASLGLGPGWRGKLAAAPLLALAVLWASPELAWGGAVPQTAALAGAGKFTVTHYAIKASLTPSSHTLTASVRVDFLAGSDLLTMTLELASPLHVQRVTDAAG